MIKAEVKVTMDLPAICSSIMDTARTAAGANAGGSTVTFEYNDSGALETAVVMFQHKKMA